MIDNSTATETAKVLLVDDRGENLVALGALLQQPGIELLEASSGRAALEQLLVHEVALAIVDVQMPEMDGFELAELMRGTERTRSVPIVFVTAGTHDARHVFRGYESGAVDFLYKPLEPAILRSKVNVFLQLHRQQQQLARHLQQLRSAEQELREADRRKDEFMALLSHELRNPLAPIRNSIYVLQREREGERAERARDIIARQVAHLTHLVDDLLDMTRVTRAKLELRRERVDVSQAVLKLGEDHHDQFEQAGITLDVHAPAEPVWLDADPTRIAQTIGNLLGNALKFTPRGGHVTLSLTKANDGAVIRVVDDGTGIPAPLQQHIFEPFTQGPRMLDRGGGGLGLGLSLAKAMIELHGGTIAVDSDGEGHGTAFTIRLPSVQAPQAADSTRDGAGRDARSRRVLVVEDNVDSAESLSEVLQLMGHEVSIARDGLEGIEAARDMNPEVVLCDIGLPGIDGYEVARRLHEMMPSTTLVALSGYALPEDQRRASEAGFAHHLAKPARIEDLERLLSV